MLGRELKILVVDDDPTTLQITKAVLENDGHEVHTHATSYGTLFKVQQIAPHVVVMDVKMPGITGEELADLVRSKMSTEQVAILFYSAVDQSELVEWVSRVGALGIIEKRGDPEYFLDRFRDLTDPLFKRRRSAG